MPERKGDAEDDREIDESLPSGICADEQDTNECRRSSSSLSYVTNPRYLDAAEARPSAPLESGDRALLSANRVTIEDNTAHVDEASASVIVADEGTSAEEQHGGISSNTETPRPPSTAVQESVLTLDGPRGISDVSLAGEPIGPGVDDAQADRGPGGNTAGDGSLTEHQEPGRASVAMGDPSSPTAKDKLDERGPQDEPALSLADGVDIASQAALVQPSFAETSLSSDDRSSSPGEGEESSEYGITSVPFRTDAGEKAPSDSDAGPASAVVAECVGDRLEDASLDEVTQSGPGASLERGDGADFRPRLGETRNTSPPSSSPTSKE
ncbi:hypothetical protein PsYK624_115840 [Phanerochaete sordida]|uniref:Uncharacterized protein n=1 Tax=Phanerochaete sordida TaxID=48140 RepID=A0A9P3GKW3_9APHY|nr:hypothetical protein PsYK624_115840 [Phanerochaete sordida]